MRGKVNYGISGNYVINGVRKKCKIDGASISKGDFVNVHTEPAPVKTINVNKGGYDTKSFFVLKDGNYLLGDTLYAYAYDPLQDEVVASSKYQTSSSNCQKLKRIGDDDDFIYAGLTAEAYSNSYKFYLNVYLLHYDTSDNSFSEKTLIDKLSITSAEYANPEVYDVLVNKREIIVSCGYFPSATNIGYHAFCLFELYGDTYSYYRMSFKKKAEVSDLAGKIGRDSVFCVSNESYVAFVSNASYPLPYIDRNNPTLYVYTWGLAVTTAGAVVEQGKAVIPYSIDDEYIYFLRIDPDRSIHQGRVNHKNVGDISVSSTGESIYNEYWTDKIKCERLNDRQSIVAVLSQKGVLKKACLCENREMNFVHAEIQPYDMNYNVSAGSYIYLGEYNDNYIMWDRMHNGERYNDYIWSQEIINNKITNTVPDTTYTTRATTSKYINGVANGSGSDGDEIECIVTAYES